MYSVPTTPDVSDVSGSDNDSIDISDDELIKEVPDRGVRSYSYKAEEEVSDRGVRSYSYKAKACIEILDEIRDLLLDYGIKVKVFRSPENFKLSILDESRDVLENYLKEARSRANSLVLLDEIRCILLVYRTKIKKLRSEIDLKGFIEAATIQDILLDFKDEIAKFIHVTRENKDRREDEGRSPTKVVKNCQEDKGRSPTEIVNECIWMVSSIQYVLTSYRAEIKELKTPVDCFMILDEIRALLQYVKNEILNCRNKDSYEYSIEILDEIQPLLQHYRHEILNYWDEINQEDCLGILNDIRGLLQDYKTEIIKHSSEVNPEDQFEIIRQMISEIFQGENSKIEELRRKLNELTAQRNLIKRRKIMRTKTKAAIWEEKRSEVLRRIVEIEEKIKFISKLMSVFKISAYSLGVSQTVAKYFYFTGSKNSNSAIVSLLLIGSLGIGTMLAEKITNNHFKGLLEILAEDQLLLLPILTQYYKTNELEYVTENIFPFHITKNIVEEFSGKAKSYNMSSLLDVLLEKRKDSGPDCEKTKVHNTFQNLTLKPSFLWNWFFSEKSNYAFIIIAKMKLVYDNVRTVNPASESLNAMCFWGSLFLDGLSLIKEIDRLRSFECRNICLIGMLQNHLTYEMLALKEIVNKS